MIEIEYIGDLCSINQRSMLNRRTGYIMTSNRYRLAKETFGYQAKEQVKEKYEGPVWVEIEFYHAREMDIDSPLKFVLDSLQSIAIENDKQVMELKVYKGKSDRIIKVGKRKRRLPYALIKIGELNGDGYNGQGNNRTLLSDRET